MKYLDAVTAELELETLTVNSLPYGSLRAIEIQPKDVFKTDLSKVDFGGAHFQKSIKNETFMHIKSVYVEDECEGYEVVMDNDGNYLMLEGFILAHPSADVTVTIMEK